MRSLVTGATGFIGSRLMSVLDDAVALSRNADWANSKLGFRAFSWKPEGAPPGPEAFDGVDTVFHLAGEPVAGGRWTPSRKRRILDSRVLGTRNLVDGIARLDHRPSTLVSASAVGIYGSRGEETLTESAPSGAGFLAEVSEAWESEARRAEDLGVRVVSVRIGIVLGPNGGALASMLPAFRIGVGGRLGTGRQWMSWIHLDDVIGLMRHVAGDPGIRGPVNAVALNPVRNAEFTSELARQVGRPAILPVPGFALRLALGEFSSVLLSSQRVLPGVAIKSGYCYFHPTLAGALAEILRPGERENRTGDAAANRAA